MKKAIRPIVSKASSIHPTPIPIVAVLEIEDEEVASKEVTMLGDEPSDTDGVWRLVDVRRVLDFVTELEEWNTPDLLGDVVKLDDVWDPLELALEIMLAGLLIKDGEIGGC
jgi:hypothetical protein